MPPLADPPGARPVFDGVDHFCDVQDVYAPHAETPGGRRRLLRTAVHAGYRAKGFTMVAPLRERYDTVVAASGWAYAGKLDDRACLPASATAGSDCRVEVDYCKQVQGVRAQLALQAVADDVVVEISTDWTAEACPPPRSPVPSSSPS